MRTTNSSRPRSWKTSPSAPLNLWLEPAKAKERALETLESLGLQDLSHRIIHQLSGGEKKLVSLATILAMRPKALLLDEPTNNLDPRTRRELIHILRDIELGSIIISTTGISSRAPARMCTPWTRARSNNAARRICTTTAMPMPTARCRIGTTITDPQFS